jgi:hypothetical protein
LLFYVNQMRHWNYRVLKKDGVLGIHAVYYDENGKVEGWSENSFSPVAEHHDELKINLELMLESLEKDTIDTDLELRT